MSVISTTNIPIVITVFAGGGGDVEKGQIMYYLETAKDAAALHSTPLLCISGG